jgi:uncharacterized protein (DUF433 family)
MATATSWITKTAGVCGGDACVRTTRHTVAGLVEWKQLGLTDARILEQHPDLTQADLDAAWEYAAEHSAEIGRALWEQRAAGVEHGPGSPPPAELIAEGRRLGLSDGDIRNAFLPPLTTEEWAAVNRTRSGAAPVV